MKEKDVEVKDFSTEQNKVTVTTVSFGFDGEEGEEGESDASGTEMGVLPFTKRPKQIFEAPKHGKFSHLPVSSKFSKEKLERAHKIVHKQRKTRMRQKDVKKTGGTLAEGFSKPDKGRRGGKKGGKGKGKGKR